MAGTQLEYEVEGSNKVGTERDGTLMGNIGEGRAASACDTKGMDPHNSRHPEKLIDQGPLP